MPEKSISVNRAATSRHATLLSNRGPVCLRLFQSVTIAQLAILQLQGSEAMRLSSQTPLYQLANQCQTAVVALRAGSQTRDEPQKRTTKEYLRLAATLLSRSYNAPGGLSEVLQATESSSTFYKRLAAVQYALLQHHEMLMARLTETADAIQTKRLMHQLTLHLTQLVQLRESRDIGFISPRRKRRSKRQALRGLPASWRHDLYQRANQGKYALPILISALTGCRPAELQYGVGVCKETHPTTGEKFIAFCIRGAKVKAGKGQPGRIITYSADDPHPLIREICKLVYCSGDVPMQEVKIDSPVNFTVEVRRLAHDLWPQHKWPVTAYCFRHQWSADMKAFTDGDSVSLGLGHASAKTRRTYGTAAQSGADGLTPRSIKATNPIRQLILQVRSEPRTTLAEP